MNKLIISMLAAVLGVAIMSSKVYATTDSSSPLLGEIKWVAFNFAPRGWASCDGQILPINSNQALFSLLGTTYGGDGRTSFALPDLRGRAMVHEGQGPGLSYRLLGSEGGTERHTLTAAELPVHSHSASAASGDATSVLPIGRASADTRRGDIYAAGPADTDLNAAAIAASGGSLAHENMMPRNTLHCIIALQGQFPSRN